ncbi:MAG: YraN family protein [Candidatus Firestonebacteria bacterium]|nr:YraN family protein [Candidatus Firestonebacteria bacterium]
MNFKGKVAEDQAVFYLQKQGYKIVERNFSVRGGEIDIIAWEGKTLCFVEVKSRGSADYGYPAEAVNRRKQQRLICAAQLYLLRHFKAGPPACRFDVISLCAEHPPHLICNAFSLS